MGRPDIHSASPHRERVVVVEVGPRDGLQNEPVTVAPWAKIAFVNALAATGLSVVETTSFVSPKAVPQLADAADVLTAIERRPGVRYPVLVPNEKGLERALSAGADAFAVFTAATEAFAQANIRSSIDESFQRFCPTAAAAESAGYWLRGYVSVAFVCPYSGSVAPAAAVDVAKRLFDLGCDEVAFADTVGRAATTDVQTLLELALRDIPADKLALHLHDTNGQAIENVAVGLDHGIRTFDGAAGGLGGCPFAPGSPGNLATERLVRFLEGEGFTTGVDADAVEAAVAQLLAGSAIAHMS
jgi:isopropylmalate/homocitrate/citramalate synthase